MLIRPRWRKMIRDIWRNKTRTLLVVLSIAIGVFAVGMIATSRTLLSADLTTSYLATNPASAKIAVSNPQIGGSTEGFGDDLVQAVRRMQDVEEAEGRRSLGVRLQVGPDAWRDLQLFAIPDYDDIRINKITSQSGAWPPPDKEVLIERSALGLANTAEGEAIVVRMPDNTERTLRVAGVAHDLSQLPSFLDGTIYGYVTFETLEWLGAPRNYNEMYIVVADQKDNKDYIQYVANEVSDKIEKSGLGVMMKVVPEPGKHPLNDVIQTIVLLLGVIGIFALLLSGFLVINTISALLSQQVRQIGVMKAIGARTNQVMQLYFMTVLVFGLLALGVAVPLGAGGAYLFSSFMANQFNFDLNTFYLPSSVLLLMVLVALLIPILAALQPILSGTRVTVREAMNEYGLGKGRFGKGLIDRLLEHIRFLSRPVLLSLRNTFRRKGRLALTLITLTMGGAIFISVFSVRDSLLMALDDLLQTWQYDIQVTLSRPERIERIEDQAMSVPGVVTAKGAGMTATRRVRTDDTESETLYLMAPPVGANLLDPVIVRGRWLLPDDHQAIVVTSNFLQSETDVDVGSDIVLKIDGKDTTWRIVGVSQFLVPLAYMDYDDYARAAGNAGRASSIWVVTERHDLAFQSEVAQILEQQFEHAGLRVSSVAKIAEEREEAEGTFSIIISLLMVMAVLLAVVGGLGLMGTMSINVLERTREFGVMRAIGASNGAVLQVVMVEGMLIGALSWLIGAALAIPLGQLVCYGVGMAFWQAPLDFSFSFSGVVIWFVVVIVLAAFASFLPAWNASRLTVRDVLAYE